MTLFQNIFTPGRPLYWVMIMAPNVVMILLSLLWVRRHRAFLLIIIGAILNIALPYGSLMIFNRGNGLGAPGTPEWAVLLLIGVGTNQGTVILLVGLLTCLLLTRKPNKQTRRQLGEPLDASASSETARKASSHKP